MKETQVKRKTWYDKNSVKREFKEGDQVLILTTARANKFAARWAGPGKIESRISDTNYIVSIPGKKQSSQIYHINMMKPYYQRPELVNFLVSEDYNLLPNEDIEFPVVSCNPNIFDFNEMVIDSKLNDQLNSDQLQQLQKLLRRYDKLFSNEPGYTQLVEHDIVLMNESIVRVRPYKLSHSIIKTEYFPLPNIKQRVELVSVSKYITLLDLAKGYWQIPLSPRAQRLAAFVTNFGKYRPLRMPFSLKNAPYFFSKMMAELLNGGKEFAVPYLDDVAVF
ncbi:hypothetical protein AVEN_133378-1 [Araneus ventricosus]|uniref:Uncharacterized protein n=1 Tax=Araneus ventricosus TaxID=182803 RepID=A0A4Y2S9X3_ARAVE|nr:hypothetical protein AVEN_133378-1 [Araneus ventricosus]